MKDLLSNSSGSLYETRKLYIKEKLEDEEELNLEYYI